MLAGHKDNTRPNAREHLMKAIVYPNYGSPDVLRLEDVPEPDPGDHEILIKVHAVSINSWDWDMLTGRPLEYRFLSGLLKPKSTLLHGCDIAGEVEAVGRKVTQFNVGDAVFGDLAEHGWGAFAEYACVRETDMTLKPSGMPFQEAACLSHGGNLAVQGLIDYGRIQAGQRVLINGGCGSTGTLAIQIAKLSDVEITCVDSTEKLDTMRSLGADHVVDYTKEDFTLNGQAYDLIFDVQTNRSVFDYTRALSPNGSYVTVGGRTSRILQLLVFKKMIKKHKLHMVGYKPNKDVKYLIALYDAGNLKPVIDTCYTLEETADAFRHFGEGRFKGKIVVTMPPS